MSTIALNQVKNQALLLPIKERAWLIYELLESLDSTNDPEIEQAWITEAEKRNARYFVGQKSCQKNTNTEWAESYFENFGTWEGEKLKRPEQLPNNLPKAILMPIDEYERIQEAFELLEHAQIYQTLISRLQTPVEDYLDHAELLKQLQQD